MNVNPNPFRHLDQILGQPLGHAQCSNGVAIQAFPMSRYGLSNFGARSGRGKVVAGLLGAAALGTFGLAPFAYLYGSYRLLNRGCNSSLRQLYPGPQYGGWAPKPPPNLRGTNFSKYRPPTTRPVRGESYIALAADGVPWNVNDQGATKIWNDNGVLSAISHFYDSKETWLTTTEDANTGQRKARTVWSSNGQGGEHRKVVIRDGDGRQKKYIETRTLR